MTDVIRRQNITYGVFLIVSAALTISVQDVIFKLFSSELTLWQIFALRGFLAVPLLVTISWVRGEHRRVFRSAFGKWPLLRAAFITMTFLAFYTAIPFLSLSTVGAANYIAPIFVTLLSAYAIKETVGVQGWLGVFLGFIGVLILLKPGTDAFSPWALLPIIGAAFYAIAHIITRAKCQHISLAALSLSQNFMMFMAGVVVSIFMATFIFQSEIADAYPYIFGVWSTVDLEDWLVLLLLAAFAVVVGMLLAGAYQAAPPSIIGTFEYSYLVFVAIWDIMFFDTTPTAISLTGMILIVVAGLLVLFRNPHESD